jgi:NifU-like protein involved in Fe-S cluster formation
MYEERLLALSKDTRFRRSEPIPYPLSERRNPACGDEVALTWTSDGNRLSSFRYHALGCAVCVASCTAVCEELSDLSPSSALERINEALRFFASDADWSHDWGTQSIPALGAVRERPMRMSCVRLPWEAVRDTLALS